MDYPLTYEGKRILVRVPPEMRFDPPATDAQAVESIARLVAPQIVPHVQGKPRHRTLERDEKGQVTGSNEYEPLSAQQVAMELARRIARVHLNLDGLDE